MQLIKFPDAHLTYCTNVHPGEKWPDHFAELQRCLPDIKNRICPDKPLGIGLRLSAAAASQLTRPGGMEAFRAWLEEENLYLFTINGFPYGNFHEKRVKDQVYAPDWRTRERLNYTRNLIRILADLLPEHLDGGISTSPLSYKPWLTESGRTEEVFRKSVTHLSMAAWEMHQVEVHQNKELHLDIEPEPDCLLENSMETLQFFRDRLFPEGSEYISGHFKVDRNEAKRILQRHIRICYDTCHFAVEFEEASQALERFRKAGIRIGRVQISSALKIDLAGGSARREQLEKRLRQFDEATYLHQVVERRVDGSFRQYRDLSEAFSGINDPKSKEWRVHFHVPIFLERFQEMSSTRDHIFGAVDPLLTRGECRHFEIETYTWDVLPETLKINLADSIEREFDWTLKLIDSI